MAIEIVDFPIKNGGSFHSYVNVYQAGYLLAGDPRDPRDPGDPVDSWLKASFYRDLARHFAELPWISLRRSTMGEIWKMGLSKHRVYMGILYHYMVYLVVHPMASRLIIPSK